MNNNENTVSLFCEECGADFHFEHEMGLQYIPHYCTFCGTEIYVEDEPIELDEEVIH